MSNLYNLTVKEKYYKVSYHNSLDITFSYIEYFFLLSDALDFIAKHPEYSDFYLNEVVSYKVCKVIKRKRGKRK